MNCPNCGAPVPESESVCPSCGAQMLTREERARGKWERRRQERKKKKKNDVTVEEIRDPNAELVQSLVAELDEMKSAQENTADAADEPVQEPEAEPEARTEENAAEPDRPKPDAAPEKRSMLEQQGTVHINVEAALASLPQEEQDDFPDLRIPEIYARAKSVPSSSQKWAEKAARDVEDDWEGFDPENEDWMVEEESSHPAVSLVIGIILLISVLLALYSYFTSDLTGGIGLTAGSMM